MTPDPSWPDWYLDTRTADTIAGSLQELARYTNQRQTARQGLGLGATGLQAGSSLRTRATALAEQVIGRRTRYSLEPFNPGPGRGQIIRTTQELFEGSGTCVDFAVTLAALLNHEDIPPVLAVALPSDGSEPHDVERAAHAFVLVHADDADDGRRATAVAAVTGAAFSDWHKLLSHEDDSPWLLLDITPQKGDDPGFLNERRVATLDYLSQEGGAVHVVDVWSALASELNFHVPPPGHRYLGVTAFLPDPMADFVEYPSHAETRNALADVSGRVLLVGPSGTGKSTLALELAGRIDDRRGWFLDGSDQETLRRSLAAAEAHSRGEPVGFLDQENLATRVARARQRLASSERPWVVVVDNANTLSSGVLSLLPIPRAREHRAKPDLLVVTTTDEAGAADLVARTGSDGRPLWTSRALRPLDDADAAAAGEVWPQLATDERLPGLLRIATWCADRLASAPELATSSGPDRIVRAALDKLSTDVAPGAVPAVDAVSAVGAAAFMPAEQISVDWVAGAVFAEDESTAVAALRAAERAGLIERSRADGPFVQYAPLWMHRLVRTAVQQQVDRAIGLRVLANGRSVHYGYDEVNELHAFVVRSGVPESADELLAAAAVVDLWEGRGRPAVDKAGDLGASYVDHVDKVLGLADFPGVSAYALGQLAAARRASHGEPDAAFRNDSIERCVAAATVCHQLDTKLSERQAATSSDSERDQQLREQVLLLRGRVDAMRGILLRGRADELDEAEQEPHLLETIAILWQSYEARRSALSEPDGTLKPDPAHHIDRAWYNPGGAHIKLAKLLHRRDPGDSGTAAVAEQLDEAMQSYAGSLSLRRGEPTNYTAASLWGVGLTAYYAALYCPGKLDFSGVEPTEELAAVVADQTRTSLLLAAEHCASTALRIWTELNGSPKKARLLLRKIGLAVDARSPDPSTRANEFVKSITEAVKELEIAGVLELKIHRPTGRVDR